MNFRELPMSRKVAGVMFAFIVVLLSAAPLCWVLVSILGWFSK
jgi:hypothetical protein